MRGNNATKPQAAGVRSLIALEYGYWQLNLYKSCVRGSEFVLAIMRGEAA